MPFDSIPKIQVARHTRSSSLADDIDFEIKGHEMQFVEVELDPGESAVAEAGAMVWKDSSVEMTTVFGDGSAKEGGFMEANEVVCKEDYPQYMRSLQENLRALGFFEGNIDGRLNKRTKNAIVAFQVKNNLPVGQLDYLTLKRLNLVK